MAAYAALVSLMNNIEQMTNHPLLSNSLSKKQIQTLQEKAGLLLEIIEGNNYGRGSKKAADLERQITSAAEAAEDVIESHIVDQILPPSADDEEPSSSLELSGQFQSLRPSSDDDEEPSFSFESLLFPLSSADILDRSYRTMFYNVDKKVGDMKKTFPYMTRSFEAGLSCWLKLQRITQKMDAILKRGVVVKEKHALKKEHPTHLRPLVETGETAMVGVDDELIELMGELTSQGSNRYVLSIVGMAGMGKTTLAKSLYAKPLIIEHFDFRAWATISQQFNVARILSQLLLSDLGIKSSDTDVDKLGLVLHKTLIGRRYLIILDDLWSVEAWDKVRRYFPDDGNKSRVVLTTRLLNVARVCSSSCFEMKLLDEEKSWRLFCEKTAFPQKDDPLELESVGKEMVRLCKGLALSIVVIEGLLRKSPRTVEFWEDVSKSIKSTSNSQVQHHSLDVLSSSYNHLSPHLKPCFLYMGTYGEDAEIRVSNLIKRWVAAGFIKPNGTHVLEEIAEGYLQDLFDRNLILVGRRRCNGKIKSCRIHDLLRDPCINVAEQQLFFHVSSRYCTDRRFVRGFLRKARHGRYSCTRSLVGETKIRDWQLVKFRLLRVFDVGYTHPAPQLYNNVNLRYLSDMTLCHSSVWNLCNSLSLMWNLQTLIIRGMDELVVAPIEIWKMRQLRHVICPPSNV